MRTSRIDHAMKLFKTCEKPEIRLFDVFLTYGLAMVLVVFTFKSDFEQQVPLNDHLPGTRVVASSFIIVINSFKLLAL